MKKLNALLLFVTTSLMAWQFYGHASLNGLQTTRIFTVSNTGIYFMKGYLTLPQLSTTGGNDYSKVVVTVSKNYATLLYTGAAGASGFDIPQISLNSGDYVTVNLGVTPTTVSPDSVLNAVRGEVYYGNAF